MKFMLAALIGLITAASVSTASAHVVIVTASIAAETAADESELRTALDAAVDDALTRAIGFTPTAVRLQDVRQIRDRIYFLLLVVDDAGEALIRELEAEDAAPSPEPAPEPAARDLTT